MKFLPRFRSGSVLVRRGAAALAVAALAGAGLLGLGSSPANAATATPAITGFTVRIAPVHNPLLTLEVLGASQDWGATVDQWTLSAGDHQIWTFSPVDGGYKIVNKNSSQCLTTDGVAGDTVYQFPCVGATQQVWRTNIVAGNTVGYPIQSAYSGLYLDVYGNSSARGAAIDTWYWNGGDNQYFLATSA